MDFPMGKIEEIKLQSKELGEEVLMLVYLPANYSPLYKYSLLIAQDGRDYFPSSLCISATVPFALGGSNFRGCIRDGCSSACLHCGNVLGLYQRKNWNHHSGFNRTCIE